MTERPVEEKIVSIVEYKRRKKPAYHYQSPILRYYTPYIAYYRAIPTAENLELFAKQLRAMLLKRRKKTDREAKGEELIVFPVRGVDMIVSYAKSLDAVVYPLSRRLRKVGTVEIPAMVFPDRYSAMRHFMFSITYATVKSVSKAEKIREVVNGINVNIIEPFFNTAILRYEELRSNHDANWLWKVMRIGRAFKIMYMIDKA